MAKRIQIGGRIESKEVGGIVTGAAEILDDAKEKKQSVINQETDDELLRLDQSKQDNLTFDNAPTEGSDNPVKSGGLYTAQQAILLAIAAINELIPSAASALNQLADKAFVNSSISTNTATFRGTSAAGLNEKQFLAWANGLTHDLNDYVFWQTSDAAGNTLFKRYKWNGTEWAYEYTLNNSTFTAEQWEAIQSGITALLVAKLRALPTAQELIQSFDSKQDVLTFDDVPTLGSANPVKSSGIYNVIKAITDLVPAEATEQNQLADKADVAAKIVAAIPSWKGQYDALMDLQAVTGAKAGDMGCVKTTDSDGYAVLTFYQYSAQGAWVVYYTLHRYAQNKPATTGTTGDYAYNGMGRIELQKNIVNGVNTLTQAMLIQQNTIYVIQYDFTLGEDVTVPDNCVLEFEGGSITASGNNDTITGNKTLYVGTKNIFKGVLLQGTWLNINIYDTIFDDSAYADSYNIIQSINAIINEDIYQEIVLTKDYIVKFSTVDPHYAFYVGSNTKFQVLGTLTAETTAWTHYRIITCHGTNIELCGGGTIIGDVETHTGTEGEYGHGVSLEGCKKSSVHDLNILKCWGDSLNISGDATPAFFDYTYASEDVIVYNVKCDSSRRQGLSITYAKNIIIENCSFINTGQIKRTNPTRGIDIEPTDTDVWKHTVEDIIVRNCYFDNNYYGAIAIQGGNTSHVKRITIDNCVINNESITANAGSDIKILNTRGFPLGARGVLDDNGGPVDISIDNSYVKSFYFEGVADSKIKLCIQNCTIDNPSLTKNFYAIKEYVKLLNCQCNGLPATTVSEDVIFEDCIFNAQPSQGSQPKLAGNVYVRNCKFGYFYRYHFAGHISLINCEFYNEYKNGAFTLTEGGDLIELRNCVLHNDSTPIFFWQVGGDWSQGTLIVEGIFTSSQTVQVDASFGTYKNRIITV